MRLEDVSKVYGGGATAVTALHEVSHAFASGSFTAVMGQSGSGKTTLLQCAAGLTRPTSGTVSVAGVDVTGLSEAELAKLRGRRIGFVFQSFNLLPALTARQNIALPLRLARKGAIPDRVAELLVRARIAGLAGRRPHELSGGEQQRVAICRALVAEPDVVFADEPTGNLDSASGRDVMTLLREVVDDLGQTVILVTHDPAVAVHADRVLILSDGRIVDAIDAPTPDAIALGLAVNGRRE
ncbi:ABC transporter ATP-binding protein [Nonomuraea typhae]|uniref:ABC transporter ATP-binding protein n=1 Tax=Nonomuraea typhae TaxID=2603600 RepID=A0ABW7Z0W1_9ACTN